MGIVIDWVNTINSTLEEITDYEAIELSESDYEELYRRAENELDGYDDIEEHNVEAVINVYLQEQGHQYDYDECYWHKE